MRYLIYLLITTITISAHAQSKEELFEKAKLYRDSKDYKNAIKQIDLALNLDSANYDFLLFKANSLFDFEQYKFAYETYSKLIELYPKDPIALSQRGLLLKSLQEFDYAMDDFNRALSFNNPDSIKQSLLVNRGTVKINIRDFQGAYSDFIAAYKIDSLEIGTLNNLATVCDEVGKGDETFKYLYKILEIDSTFVGAYVNIGFKYQEMGEYKKAIPFFNKVLSLQPDEPLSYNNRGYNRFKLGDLNGALSDVDKSIELYPGNSYAYRNRALILIAQNKIQSACADLETALKMGFTKMYGSEVEELQVKHCLKRSL